ncbi:MAG: inorganic diphosphatase [Dehalococcoidia bacterium]|nr:inorganic diphosphatase [Dehalococcoidia bacterium]
MAGGASVAFPEAGVRSERSPLLRRNPSLNLYHLPPGPQAPKVVNAIVEIPRGESNKYEYDPEIGLFRLDRVLYSAVHYPAAYGFVPGTLADDGDAVDIFVLTTGPTFTGALIEARPVGMLRMRDEAGEDEKVLSVATADPRFTQVCELEHIAPHFLREVEHFFRIYKELEGKPVETFGWKERAETESMIERSILARAEAGDTAH